MNTRRASPPSRSRPPSSDPSASIPRVAARRGLRALRRHRKRRRAPSVQSNKKMLLFQFIHSASIKFTHRRRRRRRRTAMLRLIATSHHLRTHRPSSSQGASLCAIIFAAAPNGQYDVTSTRSAPTPSSMAFTSLGVAVD